jgi:methyl-accepting chemotaxis protein
MHAIGCLALAFFQEDAGAIQHDVHLMMIFMGIIMAGVVFGFLGVGIAGLMGLKLVRKLEEMAERAEGKVSPVLEKTHALVEELSPKLRTITTNVEQISYTVRTKVDEYTVTADEINRTVKDANKRTQEKVARVDGMVNEALNTAHHVSRTVQDSVRKPVQQIAGIIAAVKRGAETLVDRSPFKRPAQSTVVVEEFRTYETPAAGTAAGSGRYTTTAQGGPAETKRRTPYG